MPLSPISSLPTPTKRLCSVARQACALQSLGPLDRLAYHDPAFASMLVGHDPQLDDYTVLHYLSDHLKPYPFRFQVLDWLLQQGAPVGSQNAWGETFLDLWKDATPSEKAQVNAILERNGA